MTLHPPISYSLIHVILIVNTKDSNESILPSLSFLILMGELIFIFILYLLCYL